MSAAEVRRAFEAEQLDILRHFAQTSTEFMERLSGQTINHVLDVFTATFDATGYITRDYSVAAGAVTVNHLGVAANLITVSSSSPGNAGAPTGGVGLYKIAGGTSRTVAIASRAFTLYGTAGDTVSVQVFTAAVVPGTT